MERTASRIIGLSGLLWLFSGHVHAQGEPSVPVSPPASGGLDQGQLPPQEMQPPQPKVVTPPPEAPPPPSVKPTPPPYSLPWGLRPALPVTVIRLDSVVASYSDADGNRGTTFAIIPLVGYRFSPRWMGAARMGLIGNSPPTGDGAPSVTNALVSGIYSLPLPASLRLAFFLGATIPIGTGGDRNADPNTTAATAAGLLSRSALDNAMFAVNDVTVIPGIDLAYIGHGWTIQLEATVLQLMRVKGEKIQPDAFRTNFTTGLHIGYFVTKWLSLSTELRYQRWLSTPDAVGKDESGLLRHNLTLALGPRFHFKVAGVGWIRPGVSYAPGLVGMVRERDYHIVQVDVPILF